MLEVITPAAALPVSDEVYLHSRIDGYDDGTLLSTMIRAATQRIEVETGLALVSRELRLTVDSFLPEIVLPVAPVITVDALKYLAAADGTLTTWGSANYRLLDKNERPRVVRAYGVDWPDIRGTEEAVTIEFTAGFGGAEAVPEDLKLAVLKLVAAYYDYREAFGTVNMAELPESVESLIRNHRRWSL